MKLTGIEIPSFSSEDMTFTEIESPGVCHLLRIPLELREFIYRMLLTTTYCTYTDLTSIVPQLRFDLQSAILLVNKQTSAEATRILYHGNDFIVLKATGIPGNFLSLSRVPTFGLRSEDSIKSPVLQIELAVVEGSYRNATAQQTLITTPEGLQPIISAIWILGHYHNRGSSCRRVHPELSLTLNFDLKAKGRHEVLNDLLMKPWDKVHGFKELVLKGDVKEPMREHLIKYNLDGPSQSEVVARLREYHALAERKFEQEDYNAAQWCWTLFDQYYDHIYDLAFHGSRGFVNRHNGKNIYSFLKQISHMDYERKFKLVIAYLCQLNEEDVPRCAYEVLSAMSDNKEPSFYFVNDYPPTVRVILAELGCVATIPLENSWIDREPVKRVLEHMKQASKRI
jgi:hypothetical protein